MFLSSVSTCVQVSSSGADLSKKQQRSDLNVPLENNNVPEVRRPVVWITGITSEVLCILETICRFL